MLNNSKYQEEFWQQHARFLHANLITEAPHPLTYNLSELCTTDLINAFTQFHQVELHAIQLLTNYAPKIAELQLVIKKVLQDKCKIFLVGCGASGRLAVLLKQLWELYNPNSTKQIIAVSSAGDISLIKAVEQFEDNAEFGIQQLLQLGYTKNDLVIGLSASGESPFILAAVSYAATISNQIPWLVFNNPTKSLLARNPQHILTNPNIQSLELDIGPMALTGSTRLQATTAMQIALGLALCSKDTNIEKQINDIYKLIKAVPLSKISPITKYEAQLFKQNHYIMYRTDNSLIGFSMLADITERAPTFNLAPFENLMDNNPVFSTFYLSLINASTTAEAWQVLLSQEPICLEWKGFPTTSRYYINGFDLSNNSFRKTGSYLPMPQHSETWLPQNDMLLINLDHLTLQLPIPQDYLAKTLIYKLYLNSHSTLLMGINNYFEGNMMLSLKPSNFKLIDRAIRYSQFILRIKYQLEIDYKTIAAIVFNEIEQLLPNQSIVTNVVNKIAIKNMR